MLAKLISQISNELSMEGSISFPAEKQFLLSFDDDMNIEALELEKSLLLKGKIGPCPEVNKEAFLLKALEANLFGLGTRGASIGLTPDGNLLTLCMELEYNTPYKEFKEKLEDVISVIDFWRSLAKEHT